MPTRPTLLQSHALTALSRISAPWLRPLDVRPVDDRTFAALLALRLGAVAHHVVNRLQRGWQQAFTPEQLAQLRRHWVSAQAQAVGLEQALSRVLGSLGQRPAIPVLVIKGAAAQYRIYAQPALRPVGDLDIWVPPGAREEAWRRLRSLGFAAHGTREPDKPAWQLVHPQLISVDLHAHLRQPQRLSLGFEQVYASHQVVEQGPLRLPVPDDNLLFLTQAYALASSEFCQSFNTWIDLRELLLARHLHVDWGRVQTLARQAGLQNVLWKVSRELGRLFAELVGSWSLAKPPPLAERLFLDACLPDPIAAAWATRLPRHRQVLAKLGLIDGGLRRLRFVSRVLAGEYLPK